MAVQVQDADQRLNAYLEAGTKYHVVPPPTGLDRGAVMAFVNQHVTPDQTVRRLRKLSRLANLYNARPSAAAFASLLRKSERDPTDFARSAVAVAAVGWLGDESQQRAAQEYYHWMLRRTNDASLRDAFVEAAFFLGPNESTAELRRWAEERRAGFQARADKGEAEAQLAVDEFDEFIRLDIPRLDQANDVRQRIGAPTAPAARAARLVALYLGEAEEATPRLSEWAAFALVRLAEEEPASPATMIGECLKAAQRYNKTDPERQAEFDLPRATALRAAVFFGEQLGEEDAKWLQAQPDPGTDLLALRPDWKYEVGRQ